MTDGAYRQFFRIVTSQVKYCIVRKDDYVSLQVSLWYTDHSTPNPLGVTPDPAVTKIVEGDKFSEEGVQIVEVPGYGYNMDNESDSDEDE